VPWLLLSHGMAPSDLFAELDAGLAAGATDWQFRGGEPVQVRIGGDLLALAPEPMAPARVEALARAAVGAEGAVASDLDAAFAHRGHYFRLHTYSAGGELCLTLRHIPSEIRSLAALGVPSAYAETVGQATRGLILVTGPAGSGKSTTLAATLDARNRRHAELILTFEDPIEFRHRNQRGVVRQLEKGRDFTDFPSAVRGALRSDPDALFVGEMRDLETIAAAITAAETGHLVFGSLHSATAADAVSRILDVFPAARAPEVRAQLARHLGAVLAQQRVPAGERRLVTAFELLLPTPAVRHLIADPANRCRLLGNEIATGRSHGMIAMDQSLEDLCRRRAIPRTEALRLAANPAGLELLLREDRR
jgi:twitching motility protein PilT